jgi:type IV pilus assembly protein PilM
MAKSNAVWGIDIGQCGLKALRCRAGDADNRIVADAFDFIEYPQILSQPEADPVELVRDALRQFLSRNVVRGDRVAVSVSGQSGLARFIKLPPVESKKIPDIVKYEARQQIPFPLDDVVWDYQQMAGGSEEEGFVLETEVGLFAMKRDQAFRALKPFDEAGIEVDIIQLTPLAIYNFTVFEHMQDRPPLTPDNYDVDNPPKSIVALSLGTDTTDLVVTNGYTVWQRSLPIGGSHFTKALSKELRLTFAKAEHLKRNAMQAEDQKAVFQAMRPVFNDLLTEIQRSINFFSGIHKKAEIGSVVALGNAMKLPGLQKYLSQNLGYPVVETDLYKGLTGSAVVGSPAFKENLLSFAVCYGLTLQGLNKGSLGTNLIPREILTNRLIREKKPWAVATAAAVLLGCAVSFMGYLQGWKSVKEDIFKSAFADADAAESKSKEYTDAFEAAKTRFSDIDQMGKNIVGNVEGRLMWLELLKAIDSVLPRDPANKRSELKIPDRTDLHIEEMECQFFPDLKVWYQTVEPIVKESRAGLVPPGTAPMPGMAGGAPGMPGGAPGLAGGAPGLAGGAPAAPGADGQPAVGDAAAAAPLEPEPTGEGWVIQLIGYHFHNANRSSQGAQFVRESLLKKLETGTVMLPTGKGGKLQLFSLKDLGITNPVLVASQRIRNVEIPDPEAEDPPATGAAGGMEANRARRMITVPMFDFVVQFCWRQTPLSKRLELQQEREKAESAKQAAANAAAPVGNP